MSSESSSPTEKIKTTFDYTDLDAVSSEVPIPPQMVEDSLAIVEEKSKTDFDQICDVAKKLKDARSLLEPIIETVNTKECYTKFFGVDGGIGFPTSNIGGTYSSTVGVAYPTNSELKPCIRIDPIIIPASSGAPHQNYLAMWRQKQEYLVAVEASKQSDCLFMDGTIVPSIFVRYLRSADQYDKFQPAFIDLFKQTYVSTDGKKCLAQKLIDLDQPVVGLPKRSHSRHIINQRLKMTDMPLSISDLMACSLLLKPGEYLAPNDYKTILKGQALNERQGELHWRWITDDVRDRDKNNQQGLDASVETIPYIAENTWVTYFRPVAGSPAIRIEILEKEKPNLEKILKTIQIDYEKNARLPFSVFMADRYSKSSGHVPVMIQTAMQSKMDRLTREKKIVDEELLWFINTMFTPLGSIEI